MIASGTLNRRITLIQPSVTVNVVGEEVQGWTTLGSVWAACLSLRLAEVNRMAGRAQAVEAKYQVRYRDDLSPAMRIIVGPRTYEVLAVEEVGQREALNLFVRAA